MAERLLTRRNFIKGMATTVGAGGLTAYLEACSSGGSTTSKSKEQTPSVPFLTISEVARRLQSSAKDPLPEGTKLHVKEDAPPTDRSTFEGTGLGYYNKENSSAYPPEGVSVYFRSSVGPSPRHEVYLFRIKEEIDPIQEDNNGNEVVSKKPEKADTLYFICEKDSGIEDQILQDMRRTQGKVSTALAGLKFQVVSVSGTEGIQGNSYDINNKKILEAISYTPQTQAAS